MSAEISETKQAFDNFTEEQRLKKQLSDLEKKRKNIEEIEDIKKNVNQKNQIRQQLIKLSGKSIKDYDREYTEAEDNTLISDIVKELAKGVAGEKDTLKSLILLLGSKWVKNKDPISFHTLLNSESGSGKDFLIDKVMKILPDSKDVEDFTKTSPRVLDYLHASKNNPEDAEFCWDDKFLVLHDIENEILNCSTLKLFLSDGSRTAIVDNGIAKIRYVKGRPVVLMTSAFSEPSFEILRRINLMGLDESEEQTDRIKLFIGNSINYDKIKAELEKLQPAFVEIPFYDNLALKLSGKDVFMRTFHKKIFDFIKASCVLNQAKRERKQTKKGGLILIASRTDYENTRELIEKFSTSGKSFKPLSRNTKEKLNMLKSEFGFFKQFSMREAEECLGLTYCPTYQQIKSFEKEGFVVSKSNKDEVTGKRYYSYEIVEQTKIKLPEWEDLFSVSKECD